jgi:hypothetical protein
MKAHQEHQEANVLARTAVNLDWHWGSNRFGKREGFFAAKHVRRGGGRTIGREHNSRYHIGPNKRKAG